MNLQPIDASGTVVQSGMSHWGRSYEIVQEPALGFSVWYEGEYAGTFDTLAEAIEEVLPADRDS